MNKWLKKLDDTMAAAAFAEEGEFEAARDIIQNQKTIILALTGEKSDANAFKYAVSVCQRLYADIEVLYSDKQNDDLLEKFRSELRSKGIDHRFIKAAGCVKEEVFKHTDKRRDILFVVVESSDGLDLNCKKTEKVISSLWINLKCPLVVVSDLACT